MPKAINDVVLKAMAPDVHGRYQRASDMLDDILAVREAPRRPGRVAALAQSDGSDDAHEIQARLRARAMPQARFCWHCRKPLHARSDRCPFCGEAQ